MIYVTTGGKIVLTPSGKIALECCCTPKEECNCCCDPTIAPWYQQPLTITITDVHVSGAADPTILNCLKGTWVLPYGKAGIQTNAPQPGDPPVICYWSNTFCAGPDDDSGIFYIEASVEQQDPVVNGSSNFKCLTIKIELVSCQDCRNQVLLYKPSFLMTLSAQKCGDSLEGPSLNPLPEYASLNLTDPLATDLGENYPYDLGGCGCNKNITEYVLDGDGNPGATNCWEKTPGVFAGNLHITNARWEPSPPVDLAAISLTAYQKQIAFTKSSNASSAYYCQWSLMASEAGFYGENSDPNLNGNLVVSPNSDLFYLIRVGTGYTNKSLSFPPSYVFTPRSEFKAEVGCRNATKRKNEIGSIYNTISGLTYKLYVDFEYDLDPYGSYHYSFDINADPLACPSGDGVSKPCQCEPSGNNFAGKVGVLKQRYFPGAGAAPASTYSCTIDASGCNALKLRSAKYLASRSSLVEYGGTYNPDLAQQQQNIIFPYNKSNCIVVSFEKNPPETSIPFPASDTNDYSSLQSALVARDKAPIGARYEIILDVAGKQVSVLYEKLPSILIPGETVAWVMHPSYSASWIDAENNERRCPVVGYRYYDVTHWGGQGIAFCSENWSACTLTSNINSPSGLNSLKQFAEVKPGRVPATSLHPLGVATDSSTYGVLHTQVRVYTRALNNGYADNCCKSVVDAVPANLDGSCNPGAIASGALCKNVESKCYISDVYNTGCNFLPITYGKFKDDYGPIVNACFFSVKRTDEDGFVDSGTGYVKSKTFDTTSGCGGLKQQVTVQFYTYDPFYDEMLKITTTVNYTRSLPTCNTTSTTTIQYEVMGKCQNSYPDIVVEEPQYNVFGDVYYTKTYTFTYTKQVPSDGDPWGSSGDRLTLRPIINQSQKIYSDDIHPLAYKDTLQQNAACVVDEKTCIQGILESFAFRAPVGSYANAAELRIQAYLGVLNNGINGITSDNTLLLKIVFKIPNGNTYCTYLTGGTTRTFSKISNPNTKHYENIWSGYFYFLDPVCFTGYPLMIELISATLVNATYNSATETWTPGAVSSLTRPKDDFVWTIKLTTGHENNKAVCIAAGDLPPPTNTAPDPPLFARVNLPTVQDQLDSLIYNV